MVTVNLWSRFRAYPTVKWPTFGLGKLYTLSELVQPSLNNCNYCHHLNGLSRLVWRSPSGAQRGSFQPCIFQPCHFKKMYYRLAGLVNVMPFSPVWEELQPWWWSKNPSSQTNRRPGIWEKAIEVQTIHLAQAKRDVTIKCDRCDRICPIYAWMRGSNNSFTLSYNV